MGEVPHSICIVFRQLSARIVKVKRELKQISK